MKLKKKIFFNIHSWIGIKLSILFFIVCFSGTLATLSHEMDWLFNSEIRATPQKKLASRNLMMANVKKEYPNGEFTYWLRQAEPYLCDLLYVVVNGKRRYIFVNQYTGEIQGDAYVTFHRFFRDLHYFLYIPNEVGNYIVLAFGFLLFISVITAFVFFKNWWRKLFVLQTGKGALVLFRSLHRLLGLWSVPFTLLFSITGIWYFLERADVAGVFDKLDPEFPKIVQFDTKTDSILNLAYALDYDRAIKIAEASIPNLKVQDLIPTNSYKNPLCIKGKTNVPLVRQRANRVYINPGTYEVIKVQNAKDSSTLMWINDIADPLHFGNWGGLITKIIWFVFGLGICSLILSGIWITLKRKLKQQTNTLGIWKYINWCIYGAIMYYMYRRMIFIYQMSTIAITIITLAWLFSIGICYYVFDYRLKKTN